MSSSNDNPARQEKRRAVTGDEAAVLRDKARQMEIASGAYKAAEQRMDELDEFDEDLLSQLENEDEEATTEFYAAASPYVVLALLDEREALRAALEYAVPVLEEAQEALLECDDVCMTEDGDDAFAVAILKARAALSGSAAP